MGACTMGSRKFAACPRSFSGCARSASAQSPTYGVGRAPTAEEIRAWDISIRPDGKELPPGRGTAKEGAPLYVQKGLRRLPRAHRSGAQAPTLIKSDGTMKNHARASRRA